MKAWVGRPAGTDGKALPCDRCDRVALMSVQGVPLCSWHITGKLGGTGLNMVRAAVRSRRKGGAA